MEIDLAAIRRMFVAETGEGLQALEEALLILERHPADEEALGEAFRVVHTLKGNAASLGYDGLADLAHAVEDLFEELRARRLALTEDRSSLLLAAVDTLRTLLAAAVARPEGSPDAPGALLGRLRAAASAVDGEGEAALSGAAEHALAFEGVASLANGTLRVAISKLDQLMDMVAEIAVARGRSGELLKAVPGDQGALLREACWTEDRLYSELQELATRLRMVPVGPELRQHLRTLREAARATGREAGLVIEGADVEVDATVIEHLRAPLSHLIRNAAVHGIEAPEERRSRGKEARGRIVLRAFSEAGSVVVEVEDDGAGIDRPRILDRARQLGLVDPAAEPAPEEIDRLLFLPGLSGAAEVTELAGRGVGLDVVRRAVEDLRGTIAVRSAEGIGTTISLRLPLTLSLIEGLGVQVAGDVYIVPLDTISECLDLPSEVSNRPDGRGVMSLRGEPVPFVRLRSLFGLEGEVPRRESAVVIRQGGCRAALAVDGLLGASQSVVKPLGEPFREVSGVAGASILGSGRIALILDVPALMRAVTA